MDITVCSLGDVITDPITGKRATTNQRHLELLDYAVAIEDAGLAGLYIGEHHGLEYVYSSPPVILMAIADRTKTLRLGTGVTLVANLDPLRVAEDYATLDNLTGGRVELCAGRGNIFPDTYKLFGQPMETSVPRFEENLRLLLKLWTEPVIDHWEGQFRPPLHNFRLQPSPLQSPHPTVWVGGGLSQSSAELSAELGLPLMLPVRRGIPREVGRGRSRRRGAGRRRHSRQHRPHLARGALALGAPVPGLPRVGEKYVPGHGQPAGVLRAVRL